MVTNSLLDFSTQGNSKEVVVGLEEEVVNALVLLEVAADAAK